VAGRTSCLLVSCGVAALLAALLLIAPPKNAQTSLLASRATVKVAFNEKLKRPILVNGQGFTLYMLTRDGRDKPTCAFHCSAAWHPLLTTGRPIAGKGAKASFLGVTESVTGKNQVTYNHHPLYTNAGYKPLGLLPDRKQGDVNGQGNLGIWYVLSPKGTRIAG
jgi:predicted lipoprotein with Yx(FWY)xxD motif